MDGGKPKSHSSLLVNVLPEGLPGQEEPKSQFPSLGSLVRCMQRAGRPTVTPKADPQAWRPERSFCGLERVLGQGLPLGDLGVAQHSSLQGGKTQARERGSQGGVGGLASGSDIWRLRLEFMGVVTSCLVRLDSHTGSASSWTSAPLATGVSIPPTSPLSLCWKAAPDCPAPRDGKAT